MKAWKDTITEHIYTKNDPGNPNLVEVDVECRYHGADMVLDEDEQSCGTTIYQHTCNHETGCGQITESLESGPVKCIYCGEITGSVTFRFCHGYIDVTPV